MPRRRIPHETVLTKPDEVFRAVGEPDAPRAWAGDALPGPDVMLAAEEVDETVDDVELLVVVLILVVVVVEFAKLELELEVDVEVLVDVLCVEVDQDDELDGVELQGLTQFGL